MRILLATRNRDKVREIAEKVSGLGLEILCAADFPDLPDVEEDGSTLEENAAKKALTLHQLTGLPTMADDTGLEVAALDGAPGVRSARYAGADATYAENVDKLLCELATVPDDRRQARFRCVLAYAQEGAVAFFEGVVNGVIIRTRIGSGGFGYDPVFFVPEEGMTFAQLPLKRKNEISHRGRALEAWIQSLSRL